MTNKKAIGLVLGAMCFALTAGICVQIKTVNNTSSKVSQNYEENNLRAEVLKLGYQLVDEKTVKDNDIWYIICLFKKQETTFLDKKTIKYGLIKKDNGLNYEKFYDKAIVSEFDKIIPPKNQLASHEKNNTPVITLATGHFPFYNFSSWSDILKCKQI